MTSEDHYIVELAPVVYAHCSCGHVEHGETEDEAMDLLATHMWGIDGIDPTDLDGPGDGYEGGHF